MMLALRNLLRRKVRTVLTAFGVAIGVGTVIALLSVARGFRSQFDSFFSAGNAHLVVSRKGAADPFLSYLPDELADRLRAVPGIASVHPFLFSLQQIPRVPVFFFYGTTRGSPFLVHLKRVEGRDLFEVEDPAGSICLGRRAAADLQLGVGDHLELGGERLEVVGLFTAEVALLESGGLLRFDTAQRVTGMEGKMNSALLHLADFDPDTLPQRAAQLAKAFPEAEIRSPAQFSGAFDEFDLMDEGMALLSVLAVLVGGIAVMNTMLMSVFERTREIGILQAIGWSRALVLRQVLLEGLLVSLAGGACGIALGVGAVEATGAIDGFAWIAGAYDATLFVQAMAVAVGMGLVGTLYPAWRAVRITPIEALRHL